jgi:MFS superfamily sulfate permease-like transporter
MSKYIKALKSDLPASVVVFLVAVPLCLGIALGSGVPPISGLIAGIAGGIVVGFISNSHLSVSGPAAGLIATVATIVYETKNYFLKLGQTDVESTSNALGMLFLAVVVAGVFQVVLGVFKTGKIVNFVPVSVLKGMLTAIGLLLILKQLPHLIGYDADFEGDESFLQSDGHNTFTEIALALQKISPIATVIGIVGIAIQYFWDSKYFPFKKYKFIFPAPLMVVLLGITINAITAAFYPNEVIRSEHMVNLPVLKDFSNISSLIQPPIFSFISLGILWIAAAKISIIATIESLLSVEAIDKLDEQKRNTNPNRELIAQGAGNIVSGLLGGIPVTSVIVRSSANVNAGAKTKFSAILHGVLIAIGLLIFPSLLNLIPLSALAAILIYTGFKLAKPAIFKEQLSHGKAVFIPFIVTIISILLSDLLIGILIGIVVGVFFIVITNFKASLRFASDDGLHVIRFGHQVTFLNKVILKEKLDSFGENDYVVIDLHGSTFIDYDILEILHDFNIHAKTAKIRVEYKFKNNRQFKKYKLINNGNIQKTFIEQQDLGSGKA